MKTVKLLLVLAVAAAGFWFGRSMWAARHGLVTLQVRNAPLVEVAKIIENQIHQKIRVDQKLNAIVTLDVHRMPLTNVLDLLADQAGARWGKTHAVYDSENALSRLEDVFSGGSTLDAAGWTNLAPRFDKIELPHFKLSGEGPEPRHIEINAPDGGSGPAPSDADIQKLLHDHMKNGAVTMNTEDVSVGPDSGGKVVMRGNGPGGGDGQPNKRVMMRVAKGPGGVTTTTTTTDGNGERVNVTRSSPDGAILQQDDWSRERLVMVTPLCERLGDAIPEKATREAAEQAAAKVHGKYAFYYSLEMPPLGGDFRSAPRSGTMSNKGGTNNPMAELEADRKENMLGGMGKLSPEQQVQRARQIQETKDSPK